MSSIFSATPAVVSRSGTLRIDVCSVTWTTPRPCGDFTAPPLGRNNIIPKSRAADLGEDLRVAGIFFPGEMQRGFAERCGRDRSDLFGQRGFCRRDEILVGRSAGASVVVAGGDIDDVLRCSRWMPASERVVRRRLIWLSDFGDFGLQTAVSDRSAHDFGMSDDDRPARGEDSRIGTGSHDDFGADAGDIAKGQSNRGMRRGHESRSAFPG